MDKKTLGIFCKKDKTWYYLETGDIHLNNYLPRIKKTLIQRGLIILDPESQTDSESYEVLKYSEVLDKNYKTKPIFLNSHIKEIYENKETQDSGKWS